MNWITLKMVFMILLIPYIIMMHLQVLRRILACYCQFSYRLHVCKLIGNTNYCFWDITPNETNASAASNHPICETMEASDKTDELPSPKKRRNRNLDKILKGLEYKVAYHEHKKSKIKYIQCMHGDCRKKFEKSSNFISHSYIHKSVRKYVWDICQRNFTQKGNMNKHIEVHMSGGKTRQRKC